MQPQQPQTLAVDWEEREGRGGFLPYRLRLPYGRSSSTDGRGDAVDIDGRLLVRSRRSDDVFADGS